MAHAHGNKPYLVDVHVHGAGEYDTRTRRQDDLLRIAALHGERGTAAFLPTISPASLDVMRDNMDAVMRAMAAQTEGARILGVHLEGPFLNRKWAGSLNQRSFAAPSIDKLDRLLDGYESLVKIMTVAPELPGALELIAACRERGLRVQMGHSDATFEQAEEGKRAGATGITHLFNAMRGFHHREPGLAGFGLMDEDIYVEIIADNAHLHPRSLKMVLDMKSADKILLISDSVKGAGWGSGPIRDKSGMLLGSGITLSDCVRNLVNRGVPQDRALHFASDNPITYLGVEPGS